MKILEMKFERSKTEDMDEILSLINETNREWYSRIIPEEHWFEPFLTREQLEEMATFMEFFVHRNKGVIVAVGSFSIRSKEIAWIPLMYVRSDHQRKGIGSSLMIYLEKLAREQHFRKIQLETDSEAKWALDFYNKHGYSIIKREKNPWGFHVWMEKQIL